MNNNAEKLNKCDTQLQKADFGGGYSRGFNL